MQSVIDSAVMLRQTRIFISNESHVYVVASESDENVQIREIP